MYAKSRPSGSVSPSQAIEVYDLQEKTTTSYNSIREAARALNISSYKSIYKYIIHDQTKLYKARYTFALKK